jgi:hypothetical protein
MPTRPLAVLALVTSGCWASESQLRTRAAADFDCAPETLTVVERDGVHRVAGCGQSDGYIYVSEAKAWLPESEAGGRVIIRDR